MTSQPTGEQLELLDPASWSGKMSQELCPQTKEKTSEPSSKRSSSLREVMPLYLDLRQSGLMRELSWTTGGRLLGEYTMRSFGEHPREDEESHLLWILEARVPFRFCLSDKACLGIVGRTKARGKALPEMLEQTLLWQARCYPSWREQVATGGQRNTNPEGQSCLFGND